MTARQTYMVIGATLVAGGITYGMVTRRKRTKMINEIYDKLERDTGGSGTHKDLESSDGFDPNFWKKVKESGKSTKFLKVTFAKKYAKQIYDALNGWDDEGAVFAVYNGIRNLVQASQIAYYFSAAYKQPLYSYMDDDLNDSEMEKVRNYLKTKPRL